MIRDRDKQGQFISYEGLGYRNIKPTDIDGAIEYHNKCWVLLECKFGESPLPSGQKLFMERFCDMAEEAGRAAIILVAKHTETDTSKDVILADCELREYYWKGEWRKPQTFWQVGDAVYTFLAFFGE